MREVRIVLEGDAGRGDHRLMALHLDHHRRLEDAELRTAAGLGGIEGNVCGLHDLRPVASVARDEARADAGAAFDQAAAMPDRLAQRGEDAPRDGFHVLVASGGDQQRELVAAGACDQVLVVHGFGKPCRDRTQQRIPRVVAECIVDALEVVDIDDEHGGGGRRLAGKQGVELFLQQGTIGQTRQRIVLGHPDRALLRPLLVRDVARDHDQPSRRIAGAAHDVVVPVALAGRVDVARRQIHEFAGVGAGQGRFAGGIFVFAEHAQPRAPDQGVLLGRRLTRALAEDHAMVAVENQSDVGARMQDRLGQRAAVIELSERPHPRNHHPV
jgi:hypothetical protein